MDKTTLRTVTNSDLLRYEPLITSIISSVILKNWSDCNYFAYPDVLEIGKTGHTIEDLRQEFRLVVFKALSSYCLTYTTSGSFGNRRAKESSYVHTCVKNKANTFVRRYSKFQKGYGVVFYSLDQTSSCGNKNKVL